MNTQTFFLPGEQAELARKAGLPAKRVWEYLNGKPVSVKRARLLEAASLLALGRTRVIPAAAWLGLEKHPALKKSGNKEIST